VLREVDFDYFKFGIIPWYSLLQSDMYWAETLKKKVKNAYAYKKLPKRGLLHWELIFG
jgi:hypothetical protein